MGALLDGVVTILAFPGPVPLPSALPPGLHRVIPAGLYHQREPGVASNTVLRLVERAPACALLWYQGQEPEPTPALILGNAIHCAALEPARFALDYAIAPDFGDCRLKGPKANREAWRARYPNRIWLSCDDGATVLGAAAAVRAHPLIGRMLEEGDPEVTIRWDDAETGLPCKGRVDWYAPGLRMVLDLKTTQDARARGFERTVAEYGYHRQEALYREGLYEIGEPEPSFVFAVVEKEPPYLCALYTLDAEAVRRGALANRRNLATLAACVARDEWPGLPDSIQTIHPPPWGD
jgi:hypothetical protein